MNYGNLLQKREASIDCGNPAVYAATEDMRVAASRALSALELSGEMKRATDAPLPLLYLAHYLGCDAARLRQLNSIADSFAVKGEIVYVQDTAGERDARQRTVVAETENQKIA